MELSNTIGSESYVILYDVPSGSSLLGNDLDYVGSEEELMVELDFEEGTV